MDNRVLVSQEILEALNAPVELPITPNKLIWIQNTKFFTVKSTDAESLQRQNHAD